MRPVRTCALVTHMCLQACLASIFETDLTDPPRNLTDGENDWHRINDWLESYDVRSGFIEYVNGDRGPAGWSIASTKPPVAPAGITHAVVCFDGQIVHDPSGLDDVGPIRHWYTFWANGFRTENHWLLGKSLGVGQ